MSEKMNIPIFIPHFGCKNDCVFCNQRKISGYDDALNIDTLRAFIEDSIETKGNREVEIAFFGGSFTGLDLNIQKKYLGLAKEYVEAYNLRGIRFSTRPDYITKAIMDMLTDYPVVAIELGIQSMDANVLEMSKRNHTINQVYEAIDLIHDYDIELGVQMMLGLPGDTYSKSMETCRELIRFKPDTVRIYPTLVIEDTELADMYKNGLYQPLSLKEAVAWTAEILSAFKNCGISVIRVGLQDNEDIKGASRLAGPYHPAFKELVLDEMVFMTVMNQIGFLDEECQQNQLEPCYELAGGQRVYQRLIGHKKGNVKRFEEKGIRLKQDMNLNLDTFWLTRIKGGTVLTGTF